MSQSAHVVKQTGKLRWTVGYYVGLYTSKCRWIAISDHQDGSTAGVIASRLNGKK